MKKFKFILTAIILCAAALCSALFCACNGEEAGEDIREETEEIIRGEIYTLQQAFDNGYLSHEDLENIKRQPSDKLSDNLKASIRQTVVDDINNEFGEGTVTLEKIGVRSYYGTFNGGIAIKMLYFPNGDGVAIMNDVIHSEVVDGVEFSSPSYTQFFYLKNYIFSDMVMLWKPKSGQENQTQGNMIEDIYYNKYGYNFVYDEYYGVYDGAEVYFQSGDMTVVKSIKVADCVFKYSNDWNIYVFKDSDVYKLEEAYQTGILSAQTVSEIAERHKQYAKANSGQSDDEFESWYYEEEN